MIDWGIVLVEGLAILASVATILFVFWLFYWVSKRRYREPKQRPFCPKCGSTALVAQKKDVDETYFIGSLHSNHTYACAKCGFIGPCPIGTPEVIATYRKP